MSISADPAARGVAGQSRSWLNALPWPDRETFESLARSPSLHFRTKGGKAVTVATDRVRAVPAISPNLSFMLGVGAIGLGTLGLLAPRFVSRTLGIPATTMTVRTLFGARELFTGYTLAGDPTKSSMLWTRVAGDIFDIIVLRGAVNRHNPKRANARRALKFVVLITLLDVVAASRMTNVKRNWPREGVSR